MITSSHCASKYSGIRAIVSEYYYQVPTIINTSRSWEITTDHPCLTVPPHTSVSVVLGERIQQNLIAVTGPIHIVEKQSGMATDLIQTRTARTCLTLPEPDTTVRKLP